MGSDRAGRAMSHVLDAVDVETYLVCASAHEGRELARLLGREMNLGDVDVMFEEFDGYGVRVRLRPPPELPPDRRPESPGPRCRTQTEAPEARQRRHRDIPSRGRAPPSPAPPGRLRRFARCR
uniref:Uncharacterized protein n=1 Tax=Desulfobacca acetoxidans TaxID=60893 RepID=A0A7V4LCG5_9BACT